MARFSRGGKLSAADLGSPAAVTQMAAAVPVVIAYPAMLSSFAERAFRPQAQAPRPLDQSVVAGQRAVYVTVAVQGQGHGTASQTVTLDVLGPDTGTASGDLTISC